MYKGNTYSSSFNKALSICKSKKYISIFILQKWKQKNDVDRLQNVDIISEIYDTEVQQHYLRHTNTSYFSYPLSFSY